VESKIKAGRQESLRALQVTRMCRLRQFTGELDPFLLLNLRVSEGLRKGQ